MKHTESSQAITLCWALSFLALFDFLGGFHLMTKRDVSGLDGIEAWLWIRMFLKKEDINWSRSGRPKVSKPEITTVHSQGRFLIL